MAGELTTVSNYVHRPDALGILKIHFLAGDDATVTAVTLTSLAGKRLKQIFVKQDGTTPFLTAADLDATDTLTGVNVIATSGNAFGTAATTTIAPDTADVIIMGGLTVTISSNVVNSAECDVYVVTY